MSDKTFRFKVRPFGQPKEEGTVTLFLQMTPEVQADLVMMMTVPQTEGLPPAKVISIFMDGWLEDMAHVRATAE